MGGRRDVALARFCCVSCMAIMLPATLARTESGAVTACRFEPAGVAKVRAISDGRSLILEDGREIRLAGIEVPLLPPAGESGPDAEAALAVRAALAAMVVDRTVELRQNGAPADRYGRTLALAYVMRRGAALGRARDVGAGIRACCGPYRRPRVRRRASGAGARRASGQAWPLERTILCHRGGRTAPRSFRPRAAVSRWWKARCVSVRESAGTIYINFGRRWATSAHGHHFEARREWLHRRRGSAENARGSPRPGARVDRGAQRTVDRCDPPGADRDRRARLTDLIAIVAAAVRHRNLAGAGGGLPAALAVVALLLAGCSSSLLTAGAPPGSLPGIVRQMQQQPQAPAPTSREHQRILAAYSGAYEDPKLEGAAQADRRQAGGRIGAAGSVHTASPSSIRRPSTPSRCRAASST